jgi:hypothetical protein
LHEEEAFSVEQIVAVLKQGELGVPIAEVIREDGISAQTPADQRPLAYRSEAPLWRQISVS